jgi:hypothetical protein
VNSVVEKRELSRKILGTFLMFSGLLARIILWYAWDVL